MATTTNTADIIARDETSLYLACEAGDVIDVARLLRIGANVKVRKVFLFFRFRVVSSLTVLPARKLLFAVSL